MFVFEHQENCSDSGLNIILLDLQTLPSESLCGVSNAEQSQDVQEKPGVNC